MAAEGVDYSWARPAPTDLYKAGKRFAVRYLSWGSSGRGNSVLDGSSNGKVLTRSEADKLQAAGLSVVSNWEFRTDDQLRGRDGGRYDAREADRLHRARGGPANAPIYFSTDFDASATQLATCYEYLRGCADILGWDRIGVYGGYRTIAYMAGKGVKWLWQTYAWSGGRWHTEAQLQQYKNGVKVAGADVDLNRATTTNYGQWAATEEDEMQLTDRVDLTDWAENKYERSNITVGSALGEAWTYSHVASDNSAAILTEQKAAKLRDEAILAAVKGLDTKAVLARVDQRAAEDAARDATAVQKLTAASQMLIELRTLVEQSASGQLSAEAVVERIGALLSGAGE